MEVDRLRVPRLRHVLEHEADLAVELREHVTVVERAEHLHRERADEVEEEFDGDRSG